jgi:hypothetical protein
VSRCLIFDAAPMPPIIPNSVPSKFAAGTTVKFARILDDFPASQGWAYTIYFNGALNVQQSRSRSADGSFLVTLDSADTSSIAPGIYRFAERVANAGTGEQYDLDGENLTSRSSRILRRLRLALSSPSRKRISRSSKRRSLDRLTADLESYQIAGRQITKIPIEELQQFADAYSRRSRARSIPERSELQLSKFSSMSSRRSTFPPTWVDVTGLE